jgi:long-chain acyl-CoA synthetase
LSNEQIEKLKDQVELVVHAASNIRLDLPLEAARNSIVVGTKNVFALSQAFPKLERFGFVSTLEVAGDYGGVVYEEFLTDYKRNFLSTYETAKSEAEEFLRGELENGSAISVFRPSMVVGESTSGKALGFQSFYMMLEKLLLRPDYPVLPRGCPVDTIPVNVLCKGIMTLMEHPEANGQVYHLSQGLDDRVTFPDFLDKVQPIAERKLGAPVKRPTYISPRIFQFALSTASKFTRGKTRRVIDIQLMFLRFLSLHSRFDNKKWRKTLTSIGLSPPRFDEYLPNLLDYYFEHRNQNRLPF